jgi:curved DNA-binding protein CbpA
MLQGSGERWKISFIARVNRAYELLKVNRYSTESQIKAAYRRMVGQWHPDRLEGKSEEVRELAIKQTAAINKTYHLLRDHSSMEFC